MLEFGFQTNLDPVALYAAAVATIVLVWDIVKFFNDGPRLSVTVIPNMILSTQQGKCYITVTVKNNGTRSTTLESLTLTYWENQYKKFTNNHMKTFAVLETCAPGVGNCELPFVLEPGKKWGGFIPQNTQLKKLSSGVLITSLFYSSSNKPKINRIRNINQENKNLTQ